MTLRPDPFTEIREAPASVIRKVLRDGCQERSWDRPCAKCAEEALAALARLEREAAERETAQRDGGYCCEAMVVAEGHIARLEVRVREVEAERDKLKDALREIATLCRFEDEHTASFASLRELAVKALASPEAEGTRGTVEAALSADEAYADAAVPGTETVSRAPSASPEAAAAEPLADVLAAVLRLPHIPCQIAGGDHSKCCIAIGSPDPCGPCALGLALAALPAVDAPPRALVCPKCGSEINPKETRSYNSATIEAFCTVCKTYRLHRVDAPPEPVELEIRQNELYLAMRVVEEMPASEAQTACIVQLGERMRTLVALRGKSEIGRSLAASRPAADTGGDKT